MRETMIRGMKRLLRLNYAATCFGLATKEKSRHIENIR
jgi:hypothetical protein